MTSRSVILSRGARHVWWTSDGAGAALGATARSTISSSPCPEGWGCSFRSLACLQVEASLLASPIMMKLRTVGARATAG